MFTHCIPVIVCYCWFTLYTPSFVAYVRLKNEVFPPKSQTESLLHWGRIEPEVFFSFVSVGNSAQDTSACGVQRGVRKSCASMLQVSRLKLRPVKRYILLIHIIYMYIGYIIVLYQVSRCIYIYRVAIAQI